MFRMLLKAIMQEQNSELNNEGLKSLELHFEKTSVMLNLY